MSDFELKSNTIRLGFHSINWNSIKIKNLQKIFFQFEIESGNDRALEFNLVAYPAYKKNKLAKWKLGEKIILEKIPDKTPVELPLPLTLGNLELRRKAIKALKKSGKEVFYLIPKLYEQNPHAYYAISDGNTEIARADPSPPAPPANE